MLMSELLDVYRNFTGHVAPVEPINQLPERRAAAEVSRALSPLKATRRHRRHSRLARANTLRVNGWTVRTW